MPRNYQRCSQCIYFQLRNYPSEKEPCENLGILPSSECCSKFLYNFRNINLIQRDSSYLSIVHKAKNVGELNDIIGMAFQEAKTRKVGLSIGDVYYVKLFRENYLSSYFKVIILCADQYYVQVQGEYKGRVWYGEIKRESLIKVADFEKIEKRLKKQNKILDPKFEKHFEAVETTPRELKYEKKKSKKKMSKEDVLEMQADRILEEQEEVYAPKTLKAEEDDDWETDDIGEYDEENPFYDDIDDID